MKKIYGVCSSSIAIQSRAEGRPSILSLLLFPLEKCVWEIGIWRSVTLTTHSLFFSLSLSLSLCVSLATHLSWLSDVLLTREKKLREICHWRPRKSVTFRHSFFLSLSPSLSLPICLLYQMYSCKLGVKKTFERNKSFEDPLFGWLALSSYLFLFFLFLSLPISLGYHMYT